MPFDRIKEFPFDRKNLHSAEKTVGHFRRYQENSHQSRQNITEGVTLKAWQTNFFNRKPKMEWENFSRDKALKIMVAKSCTF